MASISLGNHGSKKALDAAIPLVPFIDLLLCCVMFLLVTAVWNDLSAIPVSQLIPGAASIDSPPADSVDVVTLLIRRDAYQLGSTAGDREVIEGARPTELQRSLEAFFHVHKGADLRVSVDDGVPYEELVHALDVARRVGFTRVDLGEGAR